jgi:hypothetical protein
MPGYRIDIETAGARSNTDALRQSIDALAGQTKKSAEQLAAWNARMAERDAISGATSAIDAYRQSVENLARAQGASEKEAKALGERAVQNAAQLRDASSSTNILSNSFASLATKITAVAGAYISLRSASEFLSESTTLAARYDTLGVVVHTVGANAGYATTYVDGLTASLQQQGITMNASRQAVTQMIQGHMDLANATKLSRAAQDAAVIGGVNSSEAFQRMTTAIQTAQPEMLRTLGINVNFDVSYQKLAATLHTTTEALTENEKMQARANATMEATKTIAGAYEAAMGTAGKQALSLERYWEDFKVSLGQGMQPGYSALIEGATSAIKELTVTVKDPSFQESMRQWGESLGTVAKHMAEIAKYSGVRSQVGTLNEGKRLYQQGAVDEKWWKEFTRGELFDFSGENSWNNPKEALHRQQMVDAAKAGTERDRKQWLIDNWGYLPAQGGGDRPSAIKEDEIKKLYEGDRSARILDLQNFMSPYLERNKGFQSTADQLTYATDTWQGERGKFEKAASLAKETGDVQTLANAERGWAEADQKLIQTRNQLIKADDDVRRSIESMGASVRAEWADLSGDKYTGASIKSFQAMGDELAQLRDRMAGYKGENKDALESSGRMWISEKQKIAEARTELEKWKDTLSTTSALLADLGRLTGNPEASYQGAMLGLKGQYKEASDQAKALGIPQDLVDQTYILKARDAWQQAYKNLGTINGSVFDNQRAMLAQEVEAYRKQGTDITALRVYAAQRSEEIAQQELQSKQAYATSFTDFLRGQVALDAGLYHGEHSRQLTEWQDYYSDLKNYATGFSDTLKSGIVDGLEGIFEGKNPEEAFKNMLAGMRRQFLQFIVDLAFDWAKHNFFKPMLDQVSGASPGATANKTIEGATRGLANTSPQAPSSQASLSYFQQGVPSFATDNILQRYNDVGLGLPRGTTIEKPLSGWSANKGYIESAAKQLGVDPGVMAQIAGAESGFKASEINPRQGHAGGLFQFLDSSWAAAKAQWGDELGVPATSSKTDPQANSILGAAYIKSNMASYRKAFGTDASAADVYAMHFLGDSGGINFLRALRENPNQPVSNIVSKAAIANNPEYLGGGKSAQDVYSVLDKAVGKYKPYADAARADVAQQGFSSAYGVPGEEASRAMSSAVSSYGAFGWFGSLGAQSILSKIDTRGGVWKALTGEDVTTNTWNSITQTIPPTGMLGTFPVTSSDLTASYTFAGLDGDEASSQIQALVSQGVSFPQAVSLVATGAGTGFHGIAAMPKFTTVTTQAGAAAGQSTLQSATNVSPQAQQQGKSGSSFSDLFKSGNGGSSWTSSLDKWGYENLGIGTETPNSWVLNSDQAATYDYWVANGGDPATSWEAAANQGGSTIGGGLGSYASSAVSGAGMGMSVSSLVYPNGTGTVGGTIGGTIGGVIGNMLLPGIGGIVGGLLGGVVGSLLGGSDTKKTEKTGSGAWINMSQPGIINSIGFDQYRTTTSGSFGSGGTTHTTKYSVADPEVVASFRQAFEDYQNSTFRGLTTLGVSTKSLSSFSVPGSFPINQQYAGAIGKNIANLEAEEVLEVTGMKSEFDAAAKAGEVYVDEIKRIAEAYNAGSVAADRAGSSLSTLSGSLSQVAQGNYFSQFSDLVGSVEAAVQSLQNYSDYGISKTQASQQALNTYAMGAGRSIAQLDDSSVNISNFWSKYGEALSSDISAADLALWADASQWVKEFDDAITSSEQLLQTQNSTAIAKIQAAEEEFNLTYVLPIQQSQARRNANEIEPLQIQETINNNQIKVLQDQLATAQSVKVMMNGLYQSVQSVYGAYNSLFNSLTSTIHSITWSSSLSPNTPTQNFEQQKSYYAELLSKVQGEDTSSISYSEDIGNLNSFAQTYLQTAKSYYGSSSAYYAIYDSVTGELSTLKSSTENELTTLRSQLTTQNDISNTVQLSVDQLALANNALDEQLNELNLQTSMEQMQIDQLELQLQDDQLQIAQLQLVNSNLSIILSGMEGLGEQTLAALSALGGNAANTVSSINSAISAASSSQASAAATLSSTSSNTDLSSTQAAMMMMMFAAMAGYATGGDPTAGEWAMVGEKGPELVRFGSDARVYNASETANILSAKNSGASSKETTNAVNRNTQVTAAFLGSLKDSVDSLTQENKRMRAALERLVSRVN